MTAVAALLPDFHVQGRGVNYYMFPTTIATTAKKKWKSCIGMMVASYVATVF